MKIQIGDPRLQKLCEDYIDRALAPLITTHLRNQAVAGKKLDPEELTNLIHEFVFESLKRIIDTLENMETGKMSKVEAAAKIAGVSIEEAEQVAKKHFSGANLKELLKSAKTTKEPKVETTAPEQPQTLEDKLRNGAQI